MEMSIGIVRIELDCLLEALERLVGLPQVKHDEAESVAIERRRGVDVDRLHQRRNGRRRLLAVEETQRAIISFPGLELLHLGRLLGRRARASEQRKRREKQRRSDSVSS